MFDCQKSSFRAVVFLPLDFCQTCQIIVNCRFLLLLPTLSSQKDSCLFPLAFANSQSFAQVLHKFCYRRNIYFIRHFYFLLNLIITILVKSIVIVFSFITRNHSNCYWQARPVKSSHYWLIDWKVRCGRISL